MIIYTLLGILILSFSGLIVIVSKRFSMLSSLPEASLSSSLRKETIEELTVKVKNSSILRGFSFELLLQKILSKFRILTLKTDYKTSNLLEKLRQKQKRESSDNYWKEIKQTNNIEELNNIVEPEKKKSKKGILKRTKKIKVETE